MRLTAQTLSSILPRLTLLACVSLWLAACTTPGVVPRDASASIYVIRLQWHIDVGFAADALLPPLSVLAAQYPGVHYLSFGFGDRAYLKSRGQRLPNMLAALWPGPGMILMTALAASPEQAFGERNVIELRLSSEQLRAAQRYVKDSLLQRQGALVFDGPGPYEGSLFIDSSATYSAAHTCNTWAAEVLKAAGLAVHSRDVVFASQLWRQTRRLAARQSARGATGHLQPGAAQVGGQ